MTKRELINLLLVSEAPDDAPVMGWDGEWEIFGLLGEPDTTRVRRHPALRDHYFSETRKWNPQQAAELGEPITAVVFW